MKNVTVAKWHKHCNAGAVAYKNEEWERAYDNDLKQSIRFPPSKYLANYSNSDGNEISNPLKSSYIRAVAVGPHAVLVGVDHFSDGSTRTYSVGLLPADRMDCKTIASVYLTFGLRKFKGRVGLETADGILNPFKDWTFRNNVIKKKQIGFASPAYEIDLSDRDELISFVKNEAKLFKNETKFFRHGNWGKNTPNCFGFLKHVLKSVFKGGFHIKEGAFRYWRKKQLTLVSHQPGR